MTNQSISSKMWEVAYTIGQMIVGLIAFFVGIISMYLMFDSNPDYLRLVPTFLVSAYLVGHISTVAHKKMRGEA